MPSDKAGLLSQVVRDIRRTLGNALTTLLWWAMWGALIIGALAAALGFVKFGFNGLLWGFVSGAVLGAILGVIVRVMLELDS